MLTRTIAKTLDEYRWNKTSQHGENGIIAHLISAFPSIPRVCLEVGAGDGFNMSNTYSLWAEQGWQALLIEGSPSKFKALTERIGTRPSVVPIIGLISPRGEDSLDAIAQRQGFRSDIGVMSVDIDSCDYWIFAHMEWLKPHILIIECNASIPSDISFADREGHPLLRASVKAMQELGAGKGYRAVACTGPNIIFVREDTIKENPTAVPDLPIETLFDHAYHRKSRPSEWTASAKPFTYRPIYTRRPPIIARPYLWLRFALLSARARLQGKNITFRRIDDGHRLHLEQAGLLI